MATVTPWAVKGSIDYGRLIRDFGLRPLEKLPKPFSEFILFRRGIIYAHRDFERIVAASRAKKPFAMMTGLMPSGKFHFGHKLVADQIIFYQSIGAKVYLAVADVEAYATRNQDMQELRRAAIEDYLTNYAALGLDLKACDFYFQSQRSKDGKRASAYYALAHLLARHATFSEFRSVYGEEITPGKMTSSLLQAADMLHPQLPEFEGGPLPTVVPVGSDQDPHLRFARDLSQRMNVFRFLQLSSTCHKFCPGLTGGKMSSSDPASFIALTDRPEEAAEKIAKHAFSGGQPTVEEHRAKGGDPDVDVSFQMLLYGLEPDDEKIEQIRKDYRSGKMLTGELKRYLTEKMTLFLEQHRRKRKAVEKSVKALVRERVG